MVVVHAFQKKTQKPPLPAAGIRPVSLPFLQQGSDLSAVDLPGNWEVPGPQAPKTTQNFYKKARSAFLF